MDDLLKEFLTETNESLDTVNVELVRFEQDPNNAKILDNIFRLVHTIKGTCGFLGLPRLATLAHSAETLMGKFRDGMPVTGEAVTVILASIDRIKEILDVLEAKQQEPEGNDADLIDQLDAMVVAAMASAAAPAASQAAPAPAAAAPAHTAGTLCEQVLERPLKPGEVSLDDLERAFREATPDEATPAPKPVAAPKPAPKSDAAPAANASKDDGNGESKVAAQSIRVNVDTLEKLMTMVSELVLTRNQLMEMARRQTESEFKVPLQRLSNVTAELQE
ncbi:MAG TPA: Hpt domain-containing protein, partial [Pseudorhodoplanes sp.]|nr:Hpt domain-containing protein [Pseudorhodoplanes sp.]